jgi:hypothetical protein
VWRGGGEERGPPHMPPQSLMCDGDPKGRAVIFVDFDFSNMNLAIGNVDWSHHTLVLSGRKFNDFINRVALTLLEFTIS